MVLLKKVILNAASIASLIFVTNSYAERIDIPLEVTESNTQAIKAAADVFVDYIQNRTGATFTINEGSIHYDSSKNSYSIDGGNPQYLTSVNLNDLTFDAEGYYGLSFFNLAGTVTLSLNADLATNNCSVATDGRGYTVKSLLPNNPNVISQLRSGLRDEGDKILNKFIANNPNISPIHCAK